MSAYFYAPAAYHEGSFATQQKDRTREVLERAGIAGAASVLDVGCGAGQTLRVVESLSPAALLIGVDPEEGACRNGRRAGPRIHFLTGEGERLPLADGMIGAVICRVALNYMHQARALREMARVLAPGGKMVLSCHGFGYNLREVLFPGRGDWRQRLGNLKDLLAGALLQALGYQAQRGSFWGRSVPYTSLGRLKRELRRQACEITWLECDGRFLGWATVWWVVLTKQAAGNGASR